MSELDGVWFEGWGRWQARLALLLALPVMLTGVYGTNYVFLAADTAYRCHVPECENHTHIIEAPAAEDWLPPWTLFTLPGRSEQCQAGRWQPVDGSCNVTGFDNTTYGECEDFVYQHRRSIVAEFGLACQEWKRSLVGTVHNIGMLISLPIMGYVSDRYGRRAALIISGCGAGIFGLCKSFVNSYPAYLIAELVETILGASVYPSAFVLMLEWLGVSQRILASLMLGVPLAIGTATLALLDYLTGYWRYWARVAYPPSFLLLLYPFVLPESVRWLLTRGRVQEAMQVIKQAARCNRMNLPEEALEKMVVSEAGPIHNKVEVDIEDESLLRAFFRYGALRRRLCVCFVWWVSAVFVFYGLAVRAHALSGSAHVNYALVAAAELPALLLNTLLLDRVGRRPLLTAAFMLTATALIAVSCLPENANGAIGTALYLIGKMGATMSLNALYLYSSELFPTRARHRLLATCSMLGRVGSILAPLTPLLAVHGWWIPTALFGALPLLSAALTRLVPDTLHKRLPDSFADLEPSTDSSETTVA